jgi:hypothetical protein
MTNDSALMYGAGGGSGKDSQEDIGWRVIDPDGKIVRQGPRVTMQAAAMGGKITDDGE